MNRLILSIVCIFLVNCDDSNSDRASANTRVLKNGSYALCGSGVGFGVDVSETDLNNAGIDVISSGCGIARNSEGDISCDPFDTIYFHEVRIQNVPDAISLGYITEATLSTDFGLTLEEIEDCL